MSSTPAALPEDLAPSARRGPLAGLGRTVLGLLADARAIFGTFVLTLRFVVLRPPSRRQVVEQMFEIGNRSVFFVTVSMAFIGAILVFQSGLQALKLVPELSLLGPTYSELLVRDLGASIGAMMLATRVGAGIAAEIGSMVVTEQVDALRMSAAHPVQYLVAPRFVASVVMTLCLLVWANVVAFLSGMGTAAYVFGVHPATFANLVLLDAGDVTVGLSKCLAYGAAIPIVSAHRGLHTFGGSEGVGAATTSAVVSSSLAVIMLQFVLSTAGYLLFP